MVWCGKASYVMERVGNHCGTDVERNSKSLLEMPSTQLNVCSNKMNINYKEQLIVRTFNAKVY